MMMVSIDKRTSALSAVINARHFAINYLPRGHEAIAETFGGKGTLKGAARFEPGQGPNLQPARRSWPMRSRPRLRAGRSDRAARRSHRHRSAGRFHVQSRSRASDQLPRQLSLTDPDTGVTMEESPPFL